MTERRIGRPATTATMAGRRRRGPLRLAALAALCLFAALFALDLAPSADHLRSRARSAFRKLGEACNVKTPYLLVGDVVGHMPVVVPPLLRIKPSHVTLCEEYLVRRERYGDAVGADGTVEMHGEEGLTVTEDDALCGDWQAPHFSILQIFASSLIAKVGSKYGLRYRHACHRKLPQMNSRDVHFDYTSVQQLLDEMLINDEDRSAVRDSEMVKLCRGCISEFETNGVPEFTYSATSHQCLLFPGSLPEDDIGAVATEARSHDGGTAVTAESQAALATVLATLTERLRALASDHLPLTDPLDDESTLGAIIFVDDTATGMSPEVYDRYIPEYVKTIQVFASASCAHAAVHNQHPCIAHGGSVRRYMVWKHPEVTVRYDVVASTAASYARMVHCHKLICPPGSVSCLLPALVKVPGTTSTVASAALSPNTERWYMHLAGAHIQSENMEVVSLSEEEQVMTDDEGIEFVAGAEGERGGNVTIEGTALEVGTAGSAGMTATAGAEGAVEFVQEVEGGGDSSSGATGSQGGGGRPIISYNPDGSIVMAAARSNVPQGGAAEGPPARAQTPEAVREEPPAPPAQGQDRTQQVQEVLPQEQGDTEPGMVQARSQEGGADAVQEEPETAKEAESQWEKDRKYREGPKSVQHAPPAATGQEQPQPPPQGQEGPKMVQQVPPDAAQEQLPEEGEDEKADAGGGGGRLLAKVWEGLWGGEKGPASSSDAKAEAAKAPRVRKVASDGAPMVERQ